MAEFGELVLVLGDIHIPHRAAVIPEKFKRMLVPNKMQHVLCTGNLVVREQLEELKALAPNVHVVRGDFDENVTFPEHKVVTIGAFRIGLCHGHQIVPWGDPHALLALQRQLDVDILITGHTHKHTATEMEGKWFLNPGSISGAYSSVCAGVCDSGSESEEVIPSFILLAIQGTKVMCYVYEEKNGNVDVSKIEFVKGQSSTVAK